MDCDNLAGMNAGIAFRLDLTARGLLKIRPDSDMNHELRDSDCGWTDDDNGGEWLV